MYFYLSITWRRIILCLSLLAIIVFGGRSVVEAQTKRITRSPNNPWHSGFAYLGLLKRVTTEDTKVGDIVPLVVLTDVWREYAIVSDNYNYKYDDPFGRDPAVEWHEEVILRRGTPAFAQVTWSRSGNFTTPRRLRIKLLGAVAPDGRMFTLRATAQNYKDVGEMARDEVNLDDGGGVSSFWKADRNSSRDAGRDPAKALKAAWNNPEQRAILQKLFTAITTDKADSRVSMVFDDPANRVLLEEIIANAGLTETANYLKDGDGSQLLNYLRLLATSKNIGDLGPNPLAFVEKFGGSVVELLRVLKEVAGLVRRVTKSPVRAEVGTEVLAFVSEKEPAEPSHKTSTNSTQQPTWE